MGMALKLDPMTQNPYVYAGANPASFLDDGHGWFSRTWNKIKARARALLRAAVAVVRAVVRAVRSAGRAVAAGAAAAASAAIGAAERARREAAEKARVARRAIARKARAIGQAMADTAAAVGGAMGTANDYAKGEPSPSPSPSPSPAPKPFEPSRTADCAFMNVAGGVLTAAGVATLFVPGIGWGASLAISGLGAYVFTASYKAGCLGPGTSVRESR